MNTWNIVLCAAALLVLVQGVRVTISADREAKAGSRRPSLGCGYAILASLIWSFAFGSLLGDGWLGIRLALGLVLLLIALAALIRPAGGQLMKAAVGVLAGGLLVGPVTPEVWAQLNPPAAEQLLERMAKRIAELRAQLRDKERLSGEMQNDRKRLADVVRKKGYADYAALQEDPDGKAKLAELAEIERLLVTNEDQTKVIRTRLQELETVQRRLERRIQVEETSGIELSRADIESMLRELELQKSTDVDPVTLDEFAEQEALRKLFERTSKPK